VDSIRFSKSSIALQPDSAGSVLVTSFKPNTIELTADLKQASLVVVSEVNYPGWEANVDGKPAPLITGDYALRTVPVLEGKHSIELKFRPEAFQWGLIVSALALVAIGIGFRATRKDRWLEGVRE